MGVWTEGLIGMVQMIPSSLKFSMEGATPSFEDSDGQLIAAGVHIRLRIKGIRSELNQMFAIGSIREDYLGYEPALTEHITSITDTLLSVLSCRNIEIAPHNPFLSSCLTRAVRRFFFFHPCNSGVLHSGLQRGVGETGQRVEKNRGEDKYVYVFMPIKIPNRNPRPVVQRLPRISTVVLSPCALARKSQVATARVVCCPSLLHVVHLCK